MKYRELQKALKVPRERGLTDVNLTSCGDGLRAEYDRLIALGEITSDEKPQIPETAHCVSSEQTEPTNEESPAAQDRPSSDSEEVTEADPMIAALVVESWTNKPELAIATIAAYSVTVFAMVVLWIALITTTLVISGLKCWYWCQKQRLCRKNSDG